MPALFNQQAAGARESARPKIDRKALSADVVGRLHELVTRHAPTMFAEQRDADPRRRRPTATARSVVFDSGVGKAAIVWWLVGVGCGRVGFAPVQVGDVTDDGLAGSFATVSANVNLTAAGTADWSHWGLVTNASVDHKSTGGQIALAATSPLTQYGNNDYTFSWTDGTPTASVSNTFTGVFITQVAGAIEITAPASTTQRTLKLFTDVYQSSADVTAALSDASASSYSDASFTADAGLTNERAYTFVYRAGSAGQTLVVTLAMTSAMTNGNLAVPAAVMTSP